MSAVTWDSLLLCSKYSLTFHLVSISHSKLCLEKGLGGMAGADQGIWLVGEAPG